MFLKLLATLALMITQQSCVAVDLPAPIVGCSEVDCPTLEDTKTADCRVADRSFSAVGVASLDTSLSDDFAWSQGLRVYDYADTDVESRQVYEKNFYLGYPRDFDLALAEQEDGIGGCALFFTKVSPLVQFDGISVESSVESSVGTCSDALDIFCVDAILAQARDAASFFAAGPYGGACQSLRADFIDLLPPQCSQFAGGDRWEGLEMQELTGPRASPPISGSQNSSSNCHPTLPKTNVLSRVASFKSSRTSSTSSAAEDAFAVTPILTVFYLVAGFETGPLREPEVQLTCIKPVVMADDDEDKQDGSTEDNADEEDEGMQDGSAQEEEGSAANMTISTALGILVILAVSLNLIMG